MEFVPDQKVLMKCVLRVEGLTDSADVLIRRVEIRDDVPVHTNNTSKVVKAQVEYEVAGAVKMAALAVKVPFLRTKIVYESGKRRRFFDKEAQFYEAIAPRLQQLLQVEVAPTLFAADERRVLFMDDLSARGYRVRVDGRLDAAHCEVALRHLARMHAASYALRLADPSLFDELIRRQFFIGDDFIGKLYVEVRPLLVAMAAAQFLVPSVVVRLHAAVEKAKRDISGNLDSSRFDLSVLNHGDLKAHNILFRYDQRGQPVQCSLIDFQICHWSTPALDIIFFVIQSVKHEVFDNDFGSLIDCYLSTLNSTFEKLNCDARLTEAQLKSDMDNVKAFKIFTFLFRTTIVIREFSKDFEYAKTEEASPEVIDKLAKSIEIQDGVRFWLEEFEKSGVI